MTLGLLGDLTDEDNSGEGLPIPEGYRSSPGFLAQLSGIFQRGSEPKMIQNVLSAIKREGGEGHINRQPFRGMLSWIDVPSDRVPSGSSGHRVIISRIAAENAIHSLLGMGVSHDKFSNNHDRRRKVGVITHAEVVDSRIEFAGYLFARDFPDVVDLVRDGRKSRYGFSYEITDVALVDRGARVWTVKDFTFTGAALISKNRAAYQDTWIELI